MSELAEWDSFCVIVGSAAGALIGLQFVVMTLIAQNPPLRAAEAGAAFATPTVVHFGVVLLVSTLLRAPWHAIAPIASLWGVAGLCGTAYTVMVARRMRRQSTYGPVFEDWLFHVWLPAAAYLSLASSAVVASGHGRESLFSVGGAVLLLLFVGIHNAWDAVAYHALVGNLDSSKEKSGAGVDASSALN